MDLNEFKKYFEIQEELSISSTSEVFKVLNLQTEEIQVVKILKNKDSKRMNFEVSLGITLNHENILKPIGIHNLYLEDERVCKMFIYEYAESDLFDHCFSRGEQGKEIRIELFKQMASAVKYLHDKNMAHGDVKPENYVILKSKDGKDVVKMIDFEHLVDTEDRTDNFLPGTELYRAPETRLSFMKIDPKAVDIYALGISLHCLLSNFLPFLEDINEEDQETQNEITLNSDLTEQELQLLKKMLHPNPTKRPTIDQVLEFFD
eukprot:TRINITY_DN1083_c1_g1_i1.p1 TRINITY_DN1083_c1_g1~~TRINITY_DN1083_c1_g1_i1.p1  ORF type:complete len:262 (+),score=48.90 TRINITY_DN1083_c1_g1_i1:80-865(+)